ncbi:DNA replication factor Cdt1-like, partial [Stegodyphus dumicola]|uniref:DNA replication factor Cdt1-like n=1 Tax=Stegodyphus dumicola TaxID=202533 RepID=UPI0015B3684E
MSIQLKNAYTAKNVTTKECLYFAAAIYVERFTRWPEAFPIQNISADSVARPFITGWIASLCTSVCTDQGRQIPVTPFRFSDIYAWNTSNSTSPIHPSANGLWTLTSRPEVPLKPPVILKKPAYQKFSHLTASESSELVLPYKYKILLEIFRCTDTVVSMLHNRKEKITFEKVQNGVQKMMRKSFTETHLGQIVAVLPSAYSISLENCSSAFTNKKKRGLDYQLVISPNFAENEDASQGSESNSSAKDIRKASKSKAFIHMSPQFLLERQKSFANCLLKRTKEYHQKFLTSIKLPVIPENSIVRWHPKFLVDSVPDIKAASLPKAPEIKICSAKDVLEKLRGSVQIK